jgi:hypothetical protein
MTEDETDKTQDQADGAAPVAGEAPLPTEAEALVDEQKGGEG